MRKPAPGGGSAPGSDSGSGPQLGASTARPWEAGPWTIRLATLAFFAVFAFVFVTEEQRRLDDPVQKAARGEISVVGRDSLFDPARLGRALAGVERQSPRGGTVESIRLTPASMDVVVARPDGAQFEFNVDAALKVTKDDYTAGAPEGLPFSRIEATVPAKLLRVSERKLGLKPAHLDYVLLNTSRSSFDGSRDDSWGAYYSEPPLDNDATAELDGTDVRLIGTPDAKTRAAQRASARSSIKSLRDAERRVSSAPFPNEAMRKQSLTQIRQALERAEKTLQEAGRR
ncbi:MAG: hypothetical protein PGN13_02605 [Patulibacter minatonensis]